MEHKAEEKKKLTWLYALIALLLLLVVFETGLLLSRKTVAKDGISRPSIAHQSSEHENRLISRPSAKGAAAVDEDSDFFGFGSNPMMEFERMRAYMNRLFNTAMTYGPPIARSLGTGQFDFMPSVDLQETDKAYIVKSDLPGLQKDKINITVENNLLTIQGVRETESTQADEESGFYAKERSYGSFARTVTLPGPVDETQVKADYQNGVLTITLPKSGETKAVQKVPIQ